MRVEVSPHRIRGRGSTGVCRVLSKFPTCVTQSAIGATGSNPLRFPETLPPSR